MQFVKEMIPQNYRDNYLIFFFLPVLLQILALLAPHTLSLLQSCLFSPRLEWWNMGTCSPSAAWSPPFLPGLSPSLPLKTNQRPSFCWGWLRDQEQHPLSLSRTVNPSRESSLLGQWGEERKAITPASTRSPKGEDWLIQLSATWFRSLLQVSMVHLEPLPSAEREA